VFVSWLDSQFCYHENLANIDLSFRFQDNYHTIDEFIKKLCHTRQSKQMKHISIAFVDISVPFAIAFT